MMYQTPYFQANSMPAAPFQHNSYPPMNQNYPMMSTPIPYSGSNSMASMPVGMFPPATPSPSYGGFQGDNLNRYGASNKKLFITSTPDYKSPRSSRADQNVNLEYSRNQHDSRISGSRVEGSRIRGSRVEGGILGRSPVKDIIIEEGTHREGSVQEGFQQSRVAHGGIIQGGNQKPQSIRHF